MKKEAIIKKHKIQWLDNGEIEICSDWDLHIYKTESKMCKVKTFKYLGVKE